MKAIFIGLGCFLFMLLLAIFCYGIANDCPDTDGYISCAAVNK